MTNLPPAPPTSLSHSGPESIQMRMTSSGSAYSGSGITDRDPVVISNKGVMTMFSQVTELSGRVEQSSEVLTKDMESLRTRVGIPASQDTTPIRSGILDFHTPWQPSYRGDFISMQGSSEIPDPYATGILTSRDPRPTSGSSSRMPNGGNVYVNQYLGTNFVQDPGVSSFIARELQEPEDMIATSSSKCLRSGIYGSDPVIIFNRDIMSMFLQVQDHMAQIERSNEVLRRDMENLRRRVDIPAPQATTTPLKSRILDFDTPYAAGYDGDFVAKRGSIRITDSIYSTGILTIQDPEYTPRSSFMYADHGTVSTDYLSGTNILQDPGLTPIMAREVHKLKDMIPNVLDVVQPIQGVAPTAQGIPGFTPPICDAKISRGFVRFEEDVVIQKRMGTSSTYDKPNKKIHSSSFELNMRKSYSRNGDCRIIADKEDNKRHPKLTYCCFYTDASDLMCYAEIR